MERAMQIMLAVLLAVCVSDAAMEWCPRMFSTHRRMLPDKISSGVNGGTAKCWGWNYFGQLGNGEMRYSTTPVDVKL